MAPSEPDMGVAPKKKRALPFKRTVARKASIEDSASKEDDDIEFFRQSREMFPLVLEEVEETAKAGKGPATLEKHDSKRRKVSSDSNDDIDRLRSDYKSPSLTKTPTSKKPGFYGDSSDYDLVMDVKGKGKEIIRPSKTPTPIKVPFSQPTKTSISFLDDSDDDFIPPPSSVKRPPSRPGLRNHRFGRDSPPVEILSDDDEVVETKPKIEDDDDDDEFKPKETEPSDEFSDWIAKAQELTQKNNMDAVITFMVTSRMPDTVPLMVRRKLGQGMKLVLDTWIAQQESKGIEIPIDVADKLFLTWKGNKVYNSSTPASLGVQVDADGKLKVDSGEGFHKGGLLMEVWTDEAYAEYLRAKERRRALELGIVVDDDDDTRNLVEQLREETPPPEKKRGIKVVLKAKELEPIQCTVKDDTTVSKVVKLFCQKHGVGPDKSISIYFDGEKLDEDSLVVDADIDPDETNQLEVHIK